MSKKEEENKRSVILGTSYVMFKENPLSVGTRLGYIFVLPASLYRSLFEVAFGNLESGKLRFDPYDTLAHTYRTISLVSRPRRFLFASRPRLQRSSSSAVYVSLFLTARKIAASSKMLVAKSLLPTPSSRIFEKGIPMHKYILAKRALRAVSVL